MKLNICSASLIVCASVLVGSCSKSVPKCSDDQTVDLVIQIARDEYKKSVRRELGLSLSAIRTTGSNSETGAQSCAASLSIEGIPGIFPNQTLSKTVDITYTSELTDDGQLYVEVIGL